MIVKSALASVATILLALALQTTNAEYDVGKYCELVPVNTKLPSTDSCQKYYTCNGYGAEPTAYTCSNTQSFDKDTQSCTAASSVNCYYGIENPCTNKNLQYVPDVSNCEGWIWCVNNAQKGNGTCPSGQFFNSETLACVYGNCYNEDDNGNSVDNVQNVCNIMQSGQYFGSFDDCTEWNLCINGNNKTGNCEPGLVYNTQSQMCLKNDGTMCERTEGNAPVVPTETCDSDNKFAKIGDANVCSMWYICNGVQWVKQTDCGTGLYFDMPTGTCKSRQSATPQAGCNRCQFSNSPFVNAVDANCQEYLYCNGGVEVTSGSCAADQFFNEKRQACVGITASDLGTYKSNNGACFGDTNESTTKDPTAEEETTKDPKAEEETTKDPKAEENTTK